MSETKAPDMYKSWNGEWRPWHVPEPRPLDAACCDCRMPYHAIGDCSIAHDVWAKIAPTPHGGGVLCPNCMLERLHVLEISDVAATLW